MFRGDGAGLVDALVEASNAHYHASVLASHGRTLTPFFAPGEPLPIIESKQKAYNKREGNEDKSVRASSQPKAPKAKETERGLFSDAACPAFFSSPNPVQVPMPSFALKLRAQQKPEQKPV